MSEFKFSCPACGQHLSCETRCAGMQMACPTCQQAITVPAPEAPPPLRPASLKSSPPSLPAPRQAPATAAPAKTCGLAIASLICSCAGLLFGYFGTIPGIICGLKALGRIRRAPRLGGKGFAISGVITGGVLSLLWLPLTYILVVATISGFKAASRARRAMANQQLVSEKEVVYDGTNLNTTPDGSGWTLDLDVVEIPNKPLTGRIHGITFRPDQIDLNDSGLRFIASDTFLELHVDFDEAEAGQFAKQTLLVRKDDTGNILSKEGTGFKKPDIRFVWFDRGKSYKFGVPKVYAMRLEVGEIKNGYVPVRIYLCLLDDMKSFVRGNCLAKVKEQAKLEPIGAPMFGGHRRTETTAPPDTKPDAAGWTFDLENAVIPDAPAAGRMYGRPFKAQAVELWGAFLTFRQGSFPNQQEFQLMLSAVNPTNQAAPVDLNDPARLNGQIITVSSSDGQFQRPSLTVHSTLSQDFTSEMGGPDDYVMRLEFGEYKDGKLPGRLYLCALAGRKSFIRGKFEARITTFATETGPGRQPPPGFNPPRGRQRGR